MKSHVKPVTMVFRLEPDDQFQAKLEDALKSLRYGLRSRFFVNTCRALMGNMTRDQMIARMTELSHSAVIGTQAVEPVEQESPAVEVVTPKMPVRDEVDPGLSMLSFENF